MAKSNTGMGCLLVFLAPFIVIGVGIIGYGLYSILLNGPSPDWPKVPADITTYPDKDEQYPTRDSLVLTYTFANQQWSAGYGYPRNTYRKGSFMNMKKLLKRIATHSDERILISVNPRDPSDIKYHHSVPTTPYFMVIWGILFSSMPLLLLVFWWNEKKEKPIAILTTK